MYWRISNTKKALPGGALLVAVTLAVTTLGSTHTTSPSPASPRSRAANVRTKAAYVRRPLAFEANVGQVDPQVRYFSRSSGYSVFLTDTEAVIALKRKPSGAKASDNRSAAVLRMRMVGAPTSAPMGTKKLRAVSNYLIGDDPAGWHTGVANFAEVTYRGISGVDLNYHGDKAGKLEYDVVVLPGADIDSVAMKIDGAQGLRLDKAGDLVVSTPAGPLHQKHPVAFQQVGGRRKTVAASYVIRPGHQVGFRLGAYDTTKAVVIDPVIEYSTFLGSTGGGLAGGVDAASAVAVDSLGSAYVAGATNGVGFPTTPDAYQPNFSGAEDEIFNAYDAFVTKLSPDGSTLEWSTYLGGPQKIGLSGFDQALGVAVDTSGHAFVTGRTASRKFPTFPQGVFQPAPAGSQDTTDAFVTELSPDGAALVWSSYLGGDGFDQANSVAVWADANGASHATVTGWSGSNDFPVQAGAQPSPGGGSDAFVARFSPDGSDLEWSTYLGGGGEDQGGSVAVDAAGSTFVTGTTSPGDSGSFPVTAGAAQESAGGATDVFVARFAPDGSRTWSSLLGGAGDDTAAAIAVDTTGVVVAGSTASGDLPGAKAAQPARGGATDAFVAHVAADGSAVGWSTYLGGAGEDRARGVAAGSGGIWVTGVTESPDFPQGLNDQPALGGGRDAFVTRLAADGTSVAESTYLGGTGKDVGTGVAVDGAGNAYVTGGTMSRDFPTVDAYQERYLGGDAAPNDQVPAVGDAFVAKLSPTNPVLPAITTLEPNNSVADVGGTSVVIGGRAFGGASQVSFGGVAATSFRVDSPTRITAVAPAHAVGKVLVTVTTTAGTSSRNPYSPFYYGEGKWTTASGPSNPRVYHTTTLLPNGKVLVAGGCADPSCGQNTPRLSSAELYDPVLGTWTATGEMSYARGGHTATLLDGPFCHLSLPAPRPEFCGKVLVAGGTNEMINAARPVLGRIDAPAPAELYDPTSSTWKNAAEVSGTPFHTATLLRSGKVFVTGPGTQAYDPVLDAWPPVKFGAARKWHTATLLPNGKVLVDGGFPTAGGGAQGGCEGFCPQEAQVFDPEANAGYGEWTSRGDHLRRHSHTATLLVGPPEACGQDCGKVLIVGGSLEISGVERNSADAVELFDDTAAGTDADPYWEISSFLGSTRDHHAAALLASGRVLVAGGNIDNPRLPGAEIYHPLDRRWLPAGSPLTMTSLSSAVMLSSDPNGFAADPTVCGTRCGKLLVVGGVENATGDLASSMQVYTPAPTLTGLSTNSGPAEGATQLTLTGTGFTHALRAVRVGDTAVACPGPTCRVDSYSQITLTVPPATDKASVEVKVATDSGVTDPMSFSYTGAPGAVRGLAAAVVSDTAMKLSFDAAGAVADLNPPATSYGVKISTEPIADEAAFDAAPALCENGLCEFKPKAVGQRLSIDVGDLDPGTTYYYAVRAVAPDGQRGPITKVEATTSGTPGSTGGVGRACPSVAPDAGQLAYPKGYSLVGLPAGTVVPALSQLYSWFDQGAGGAYASQPVTQPVAAGRGYWAYFSCPSVVDVGSATSGSLRLALGAYRASMVGNPSATKASSVSGYDYAARWDPTLNAGAGGYAMSGYRAATSLRPGEGSWVYSFSATQVLINPQG